MAQGDGQKPVVVVGLLLPAGRPARMGEKTSACQPIASKGSSHGGPGWRAGCAKPGWVGKRILKGPKLAQGSLEPLKAQRSKITRTPSTKEHKVHAVANLTFDCQAAL